MDSRKKHAATLIGRNLGGDIMDIKGTGPVHVYLSFVQSRHHGEVYEYGIALCFLQQADAPDTLMRQQTMVILMPTNRTEKQLHDSVFAIVSELIDQIVQPQTEVLQLVLHSSDPVFCMHSKLLIDIVPPHVHMTFHVEDVDNATMRKSDKSAMYACIRHRQEQKQ